MYQLRKDSIIERWVLFSECRLHRPGIGGGQGPQFDADAFCPFCEGLEEHTPDEIFALREDPSLPANSPGWQLRVVPNKFPAVEHILAGDAPYEPSTIEPDPLFVSIPARGRHEVVIESPEHKSLVSQLTGDEMEALFATYQQRLLAIGEFPEIVSTTIFKNVGRAAGASLEHLHSQILATPVIPWALRNEINSAASYKEQHGKCIFCELIEREMQEGTRLIEQTENFVALCPYAPRMAGESWILPKTCQPCYTDVDAEQVKELAHLTHRLLSRMEKVLPRPSYNYTIHSRPCRQCTMQKVAGGIPMEDVLYHWHLEIVPSASRSAGFEWSSGCYINSLLPEDAVKVLRS